MVDVDGVIIRRANGRRWDHDLHADLGVDPAALQQRFFAKAWPDIIVGRTPLEQPLSAALARIAPQVSAERFIAYWFAKDTGFDHALLAGLAALRAGGVALHLVTDQEHRRAAYLWETLDLKSRFDAMHYAADLGFRKIHPEFFAEVMRRTGFAAAEIGFIDDGAHNIEAGRRAGWKGYVWTSESTLAGAWAALTA